MTKFIAIAVDAFGTVITRYDLAASEAEAAEQEARKYLDRHQTRSGRPTIGGSRGSSGRRISRRPNDCLLG
jgi:hypothetical protein